MCSLFGDGSYSRQYCPYRFLEGIALNDSAEAGSSETSHGPEVQISKERTNEPGKPQNG